MRTVELFIQTVKVEYNLTLLVLFKLFPGGFSDQIYVLEWLKL